MCLHFFRTEPQNAFRLQQIEPDELRDNFQRDRDRILYSREFRRLSGKTQVFVSSHDDNLRTRLTHTLEVAQISNTIAQNLNLNTTLTEAIALGHDVGHTPFGHIGERVLNHLMNGCQTLPDYDKFVEYCYHVMVKVVPLKEHVIEVLNKLREKDCEIVIITARNSSEYTSPYKISYDYLTKKGVPFDKIVAGAKDKGLECVNQGIDIFIDDSIPNCRAARKKGIRVIRFDSGSKYKDNTFETARSWDEIYDLIVNG